MGGSEVHPFFVLPAQEPRPLACVDGTVETLHKLPLAKERNRVRLLSVLETPRNPATISGLIPRVRWTVFEVLFTVNADLSSLIADLKSDMKISKWVGASSFAHEYLCPSSSLPTREPQVTPGWWNSFYVVMPVVVFCFVLWPSSWESFNEIV